jgi:F-type H+-transporting ATPase subunit b
VKPAVIAAVTNALVAMPSMAGEPGKIFDFNLTLPIIATEFLLLMVILDKTIFGPVGKALDDRDALIRDQLAAVGDNSTAVADLIVSTRERPPRRSPHTRRVFGGRTNAPGAPRAFPARPTARDRRAWRSPPDTWRLTGAREPPIGVRYGSIDRFERIAVSTIRCFFLSSFASADRSFPPPLRFTPAG